MSKIAIIGAGGHTRSLLNLLKNKFQSSKLRIYDENFSYEENELIEGVKVTGSLSAISDEEKILLSIGDNILREKYFNQFNKKIIRENLFHKTSYIEKSVTLGSSNQIFANAYINSSSQIGDNNIINTSAILEHEVKIGNHNHISVGAKLCGRVCIEDRCFIGANATIIDKINICSDVIIGAGSVVIKNITKAGTYVGNPARRVN
ncbi:acetyltransferase [Arcobacter arenosus]|uniref:Acetyltransferase n=1 Tax=Arcobacter arenosus TaxID=2576037 RepID=A0A5R8Y160_9BACT|nr:acetyltransferase [Arcobacter arenosus]TLP38526.1 acetyltransferase [Arcobacter arenosus]